MNCSFSNPTDSVMILTDFDTVRFHYFLPIYHLESRQNRRVNPLTSRQLKPLRPADKTYLAISLERTQLHNP